MNENRLTITSIREQFLSGKLTPQGLLAELTDVIQKKDTELNAFLDVYDDATASAQEAERLIGKEGKNVPPLCGIPIAVKNNILIKGKRATAASKILETYVAPYDATVIERLREAGAVFVGSTNLDEFAMGSSTENSAFGVTKNPCDPTRVPGGSSGGSAAAVAMGATVAALGTDTGGSIRQPASYCGVVGLKPTYGAVSRSGLIAMGSSLDQAGPLTNSVTDAETIFSIISGKDKKDSTTYGSGTYPELERKEKYTIGIPRDFVKDIESGTEKVFTSAIERLTAEGHDVVDVAMPLMGKGLAAYYIVMPAEVSSNLARYDGVRFGLHVDGEDLLDDYKKTRAQGFGAEVKRRILLGTYVLSAGYYDAYYGTAEHVRTLMRDELSDIYKKVDLLLTPTTPTSAFKIGEKSDPLAMYLQDIFTVSANLTGVPALSVPGGTTEQGSVNLPIGIQFIAPHNGENRLFDIGKRFLKEYA